MKSKFKFKTQFNAGDFPKRYEKGGGVSQTIPDQSMSVRELMDRHVRGLPLHGTRVPIYNGDDDDMPDPATLDISERHEIMKSVKDEIEDIKSRTKRKKRPAKQVDVEDVIVVDESVKDENNPAPSV